MKLLPTLLLLALLILGIANLDRLSNWFIDMVWDVSTPLCGCN